MKSQLTFFKVRLPPHTTPCNVPHHHAGWLPTCKYDRASCPQLSHVIRQLLRALEHAPVVIRRHRDSDSPRNETPATSTSQQHAGCARRSLHIPEAQSASCGHALQVDSAVVRDGDHIALRPVPQCTRHHHTRPLLRAPPTPPIVQILARPRARATPGQREDRVPRKIHTPGTWRRAHTPVSSSARCRRSIQTC